MRLLEDIEDRLRDLTRRAGLSNVPMGAVVALAVVAVVAVLWAGWRWWPRAQAADEPAFTHAGLQADEVTSASAGKAPGLSEASASATGPSGKALVHVVGAVRHPGVYELPAGSRVADAVEAAGGLLPDAVAEAVNLARIVADGEQILVPDDDAVAAGGVGGAPGGGGAAVGAAGSGMAPAGASGAGSAAGDPVDLNAADAALLDTLPGVGPATAARIVADREANGPFASVEDLGRVSGIGPKKLEQLQGLVCVR